MEKTLKFSELPSKILVYATEGGVLLPGGYLPINLTHPKDITFMERVLKSRRLLGVAQALELSDETLHFNTGCLGQITHFNESEEGYLVVVKGLCRFDALKDIETAYKQSCVSVDYTRYKDDLKARDTYESTVDRERLLKALERYMNFLNVKIDWEEIEETPDDKLVTALAMSGPFSLVEKQALLESVSLPEQCCIITTLMEMALLDSTQTTH